MTTADDPGASESRPASTAAPRARDPLSLRGVVPPTITAFDEAGAVDPDATAAHATFVVERGVHGVFPLGTNGEQPLLSRPSRRPSSRRSAARSRSSPGSARRAPGGPSTRQGGPRRPVRTASSS